MKLVIALALMFLSFPAFATDIFKDSFESGDWSATNRQGFRWTEKTWTSIVSQTQELTSDGKTQAKKNAASFPGDDWTAKSGEYCLRFRYGAGKDWSEQRFNIGTPMKDIWIRYWIRIPLNYKFGPKGYPNKFFSLWTDGYSGKGDGSTVWLSMARRDEGDCSVWCTWSQGGYTNSTRARQDVPFFTRADRGKWMHVLLHFKTETSPGASDGVLQTWRRWDGEKEYSKLHEVLDAPLKIPSQGPNGFQSGYLLGWVNAAFEEDTEFLIDDFVISDASPMKYLLEEAGTDMKGK
ncbi:MAG: hypothetical protein GXP30_06790 [Verrucomicrobia bacterium]|nr:hypothetical protein [Verrucomicrobiota bacterium]